MGADIHMVIEAFYDRRWMGLCDPDRLPELTNPSGSYSIISGRNYRLFHHLAGVRSWPEWGESLLAPPRGFPADMSDLAHFRLIGDYDKGFHSASWTTFEEFLMAYNLAEEGYASCCKPPRNPTIFTESDLLGHMWSDLRYSKLPVRIVFAFDN